MKRLVTMLAAALFASATFACNIGHDAPAAGQAAPAAAPAKGKKSVKAAKQQDAQKAPRQDAKSQR